jgi:ubiquinone/menaquinone biosynthesis C-methylase UbiE
VRLFVFFGTAARSSVIKRACGVFRFGVNTMCWNSEAVREKLCAFVDVPDAGAVLDAGCGDGADLWRISRHLGPEARLVGAEATKSALEKARAAAVGDARFSFLDADLSQPWPFESGSFDCVFSNNVLECITDKKAFLTETARVLRPGGQVICAHWDHDTHLFDGIDKAVVRRIVTAFSDWQQGWMADADGWMGRRLWKTFQASGLFTGRIEVLTLTETEFMPGAYGYEQVQAIGAMVKRGLITADDYVRFSEDVTAQSGRGEYFYSVTLYVYVGQKL